MNGFVKVYGRKLFSSTVWQGQPLHVKVSWMVVLGEADPKGRLTTPLPALARIAEIPIEQMEEALRLFQAPDPHSRSKGHEGRRLVPFEEKDETGYVIVNYEKHRLMRDPETRKELNRIAAQKYRASSTVIDRHQRHQESSASSTIIDHHQESSASAQAEAEAEAEETDLCPTRLAGEVEPCPPSSSECPPPIREKIKELLKQYSEQDLIGRTIQALGSTRRTGSMADSVLYGILSTWARYSVEAVQAGCRIYLDEDCARDRGKRENYLAGIIRRQEDLIRDSGLDPGFKGTESQTSLPAPRINRGPVHARDIVAETMAAQERKEARAQVEAEKYRSWQTQVLNELSKKPDLRARLEAEAQEKVSPLSVMGFQGERLEQAYQANLAELAAQELGIPRAEKASEAS